LEDREGECRDRSYCDHCYILLASILGNVET
jgi:hypothetical protein